MPTGLIPKPAKDTSQAAACCLWLPPSSSPRLWGRAEGQTSQGSCTFSPSQRSCSHCHYGVEWPPIFFSRSWSLIANQTLLFLSSFPSAGLFFHTRSVEPVSSFCLRRMYLISHDLQSPQRLLRKTEILFLHLPGRRQGCKAD